MTTTTTLARQDAARQNGAKSNGPVTEAGKARSAQNATRHGLTGGPVVLPHESQDQYDELHDCLGLTYGAETVAEWNLIGEMAAARWRLTRIEHMEAAILNQAYERILRDLTARAEEEVEKSAEIDPDRVMAMAFCDVADNSKGFRMLDRHQSTLWRSYDRALGELKVLQQARAQEELNAARNQKNTTRQNEPKRAVDYSSLPPATSYPKGTQFMAAALTQLDKQIAAMEKGMPPATKRAAA